MNKHVYLEHRGDVYCMAPFRSRDFIKYWDGEKAKNINGVIFHNNGKTWYFTP